MNRSAEYAYHLFLAQHNYKAAMIDWAVSILEKGGSGTATQLLAGADYEEESEVLRLFQRATIEQGVSLPDPNEELTWNEHFICIAISKGFISPFRGLSDLYRIWINSGYDAQFVRWNDLSESIELVEDGYKGIGIFEDITMDTVEEIIIREARNLSLAS